MAHVGMLGLTIRSGIDYGGVIIIVFIHFDPKELPSIRGIAACLETYPKLSRVKVQVVWSGMERMKHQTII